VEPPLGRRFRRKWFQLYLLAPWHMERYKGSPAPVFIVKLFQVPPIALSQGKACHAQLGLDSHTAGCEYCRARSCKADAVAGRHNMSAPVAGEGPERKAPRVVSTLWCSLALADDEVGGGQRRSGSACRREIVPGAGRAGEATGGRGSSVPRGSDEVGSARRSRRAGLSARRGRWPERDAGRRHRAALRVVGTTVLRVTAGRAGSTE
jgi:hypothetical protein